VHDLSTGRLVHTRHIHFLPLGVAPPVTDFELFDFSNASDLDLGDEALSSDSRVHAPDIVPDPLSVPLADTLLLRRILSFNGGRYSLPMSLIRCLKQVEHQLRWKWP
jgi:hypothetical protein